MEGLELREGGTIVSLEWEERMGRERRRGWEEKGGEDGKRKSWRIEKREEAGEEGEEKGRW